MRKSNGGLFLLNSFVTFLVLVFLILPMAVIVLSSLGETSYATFPPHGLTLKWYGRFDEVTQLIPSLVYSVELGLLVTVCSVSLALITALGLTLKVVPGKTLISTFLLSPLVLPSVVVGLALMLFFNLVWSPSYDICLLIGHMVISFPYALRSLLPALETFDKNILSASRTLGANPVRAIATVLIPAIRPGLVSASIFAFLISFDNFNISTFLQNPINPTLPVVLYNQAQQALSPVLMAISSALIIFSGLVVTVFGKYIVYK